MACMAFGAFRLVSPTTTLPCRLPVVVGAKLIASAQLLPGARLEPAEPPAVLCGHAFATLFWRVKLLEMAGLLPDAATGNASG